MKIEIIIGENLNEEYIKFMEKARIKEYGQIYKDFRNEEK